jgi:GMP synthase-like glutamine amidotransferase
MRVHALQHVSFEGLGNIETWIKAKDHIVFKTRLFNEEPLPDLDDVDLLVVMGGPMGVYQENEFPWLVREKHYIEKALKRGKQVLGVCVCAQLVAEVMGSKVYKSKCKEIGWYPVNLTDAGKKSPYFKGFPETFTALHWHGDTFDLPKGCVQLAKSKACENQAFSCGDQVIGLQFHLELTKERVAMLTQHCCDELVEAEFIQPADKIICEEECFKKTYELLVSVLDECERKIRNSNGV